jgi:hypothetical protein
LNSSRTVSFGFFLIISESENCKGSLGQTQIRVKETTGCGYFKNLEKLVVFMKKNQE